MATTTPTCTVRLAARDRFDSFHARVCGRPLVEGGTMCSLHTKAAERRRQKDADDRAQYDRNRQAERDGSKRAAQLRELTGIYGGINPDFKIPISGGGIGAYTGGVTLSAEATALVIDLLTKER